MPAISASAPGKVILFGEHAVVYTQPAIAVPVTQVQTRAVVMANPIGRPGQVFIEAPDIGLNTELDLLSPDHPLFILFKSIAAYLAIQSFPSFRIRITSSIPIAAGMGSGAAVSVAAARAVTDFLGRTLPVEQISNLAYEVEKRHHGTPSGIDNTVISYAQPLFFTRGKPFELLSVSEPFSLIVADSGVKSSTGEVVGDLRLRWEKDPGAYEKRFTQIGALVRQARAIIEKGPIQALGPLMNANHQLLIDLDVSSLELDQLVATAVKAGALGAKLSGAGRGGNMIALVTPESKLAVETALRNAGAVRTIFTTINAIKEPK